MAQLGGLKAAAKRTAFGDLSNAANVSRLSKDDTTIPIKASAIVPEKSIAVVAQEKRPTALLRPAQRPLSVLGLKSLLHNVSSSNSQATTKQPSLENHQPVQPAIQKANIKKLTTKKSSAVFKDAAVNCMEQPNGGKEASEVAPIPPVHRELLPSQLPQKVNLSLEVKTDPQASHSTILGEPSVPEPSIVIPSSEEAAPCRSDGIYIDNHGEIQRYVFSEDIDTEDNQNTEPVTIATGFTQAAEEESLADRVDRYLKEQGEEDKQLQAEVAAKQIHPTVSEPEVYWDEEDGAYEEEGYVTARSFKSRGENTTGGATTVLFPKVNQKIKKELAAAKELIESTRTPEDIDDETWDTSMVAEYGDEIFGYMRDLEASTLYNEDSS